MAVTTGPESGIGLADSGTQPTAAARTNGNHVTIDAILSRDNTNFRFLAPISFYISCCRRPNLWPVYFTVIAQAEAYLKSTNDILAAFTNEFCFRRFRCKLAYCHYIKIVSIGL